MKDSGMLKIDKRVGNEMIQINKPANISCLPADFYLGPKHSDLS